VVLRNSHHRALNQAIDVLATASEQLAQAAGHRSQHHVADLGIVDVGNLLGDFEAAADNGQPTLSAHGVVEARPWGRLVGEHLLPRRQRPPRYAQCPGRMDKARPPAT
jgi:hypothetical protein